MRVVAAEDDYLLREGLRLLFDTQSDLQLLAVCGDMPALLETVAHIPVDVVLTDIRMPPRHRDEGVAIAEWLRDRHPDVGVVLLSQYAELTYARRVFAGGSAGRAYLLKERVGDLDTLFDAVRVVSGGGSVLDPRIVELLVSGSGSPGTPLAGLSRRELEVLGEMASGRSNAGIGEALHLSERGVEKHINSIFTKLDLPSATEVNRRVLAVRLFLGLEVQQG